MSKEYLEALDRMSFHRFDEQYEEWDSDYATVENYLESIDNAKPSEALDEIFNIIYNFDCGTTYEQDKKLNEYRETIKQALLKAQEQEKENAEDKKLLDILKSKKYIPLDSINPRFWNDKEIYDETVNYEFYLWLCEEECEYVVREEQKLTEEEFDLLKRYFE